jgi:(p)ppGpp synthase/HD superfamily hydrolase
MIVSEYTDDEDATVAALLHDILEDVSGKIYSSEDMRRDFGEKVVGIVEDVSENKRIGEPEKPWRERKEAYLEHLRSLDDVAPLLVSVADKIHNLMSILADYDTVGDKVWDRFNASKEDELWYYRELVEMFNQKIFPEALKTRYNTLFTRLKEIITHAQR